MFYRVFFNIEFHLRFYLHVVAMKPCTGMYSLYWYKNIVWRRRHRYAGIFIHKNFTVVEIDFGDFNYTLFIDLQMHVFIMCGEQKISQPNVGVLYHLIEKKLYKSVLFSVTISLIQLLKLHQNLQWWINLKLNNGLRIFKRNKLCLP